MRDDEDQEQREDVAADAGGERHDGDDRTGGGTTEGQADRFEQQVEDGPPASADTADADGAADAAEDAQQG